jgi:uncharacterized NAD(P)/FAD-binding protein YdhS
VAAQLLRRGFGGSIAIAEPRAALGRGLAYSTPYGEHLLNVPAAKMSAFPDEPGHFLAWLRAGRYPDAPPTLFAPRRVYGEYLESVLEQQALAGPGTLAHIRGEVKTILPDPSGLTLALGAGPSGAEPASTAIHAKRVVLALGNPASSPIPRAPEPDMEHQWHLSPWFGDALRVRHAGERVLLVGTGLTAMDAALALQHEDTGSLTYMLSRRGILPQEHDTALAPVPPPDFGDRRSLRPLVRQVRGQIRSLGADARCWRAAIDSLRPLSNQLWQDLTHADRLRFLRHVKRFWEAHRHRMAPEIHGRIEELRASGSLEVIAGRIRESRLEGDSIAVEISLREGGGRTLHVDRVINCTGIHENFVDHPRPLIASLIEEGLACPNELGIGFRTDAGGALLDASGNVSETLFTLGPPRRGDLFETTAVPEIRAQADALALRLMA